MVYAIIGLIAIVLFLCLLVLHQAGFRITRKHKVPPVNEEDKRKAEQLQKEFGMMMDYNLAKALDRKR